MGAGPITFRRLTRDDFATLARWLAEPHVHRWWHHEFTPEAVERDFGGVADGTEPSEDWLVSIDDEPIGLIQYSRFVDHADSVAEMEPVYPVGPGMASIDYLIGDPARVGRGVGTEVITRFVEFVWSHDPSTECLVVPVNSANVASWRALLGAGFELVARGALEPDNPRDDPMHEILRIDRPAAI